MIRANVWELGGGVILLDKFICLELSASLPKITIHNVKCYVLICLKFRCDNFHLFPFSNFKESIIY